MARLILVPNYHPILVVGQSQQQISYPVMSMGTPQWTTSGMSAMPSTSYVTTPVQTMHYASGINPVDVEMAWRSRDRFQEKATRQERELAISEHVLQGKLWDMREIEAWVMQHAKDDVIVQFHDVAGIWYLIFVLVTDKLAFAEWFGEQQLSPPVIIRKSPMSHAGIVQGWLDANMRDRFRISEGIDEIKVFCRDLHDRVHLAMRWAGCGCDEEVA